MQFHASATQHDAGGHGPFDRPVRWKTWWIWLWGVVSVGLLVSVWFRAPFMAWSLAAVATFGVMETIGLLKPDDAYPPLTHVIREYLPRWLAFTLILSATGLAAGTWFRLHQRVELALITGLAGWFVAHFDTAYDEETAAREHVKYQWYAHKLRRARHDTR